MNTNFEENGYRLYHFAFLNFDYAPLEWISIKIAGEVYRSEIVLALEEAENNNPFVDPDDEGPISLRYKSEEWVTNSQGYLLPV